jgi:hypothetical protein
VSSKNKASDDIIWSRVYDCVSETPRARLIESNIPRYLKWLLYQHWNEERHGNSAITLKEKISKRENPPRTASEPARYLLQDGA